jgi:hypothetical protein
MEPSALGDEPSVERKTKMAFRCGGTKGAARTSSRSLTRPCCTLTGRPHTIIVSEPFAGGIRCVLELDQSAGLSNQNSPSNRAWRSTWKRVPALILTRWVGMGPGVGPRVLRSRSPAPASWANVHTSVCRIIRPGDSAVLRRWYGRRRRRISSPRTANSV